MTNKNTKRIFDDKDKKYLAVLLVNLSDCSSTKIQLGKSTSFNNFVNY